MYRLGDTGIVVEYINYMLGIKGNKFTEETEQKLKLYQQSYNQEYVDNSDKLYYNDYAEYNNNFNNYISKLTSDYFVVDSNNGIGTDSLWLYPNGVVNLPTLTALTDIDIKIEDAKKIRLVQSALYYLGYLHDGNPIQVTGFLDDATQDALRQFQKKYQIYQPYTYIIDGKNLLSSSWSYIYVNNTQTITEDTLANILPNALSNVLPDSISDNTNIIQGGSVRFNFTINSNEYNLIDYGGEIRKGIYDATFDIWQVDLTDSTIYGSINYTNGQYEIYAATIGGTAPETITVYYLAISNLSMGSWGNGSYFYLPNNNLDYTITDFIDTDFYQVKFYSSTVNQETGETIISQIPYSTLISADSRYAVFGSGENNPNWVQGSNIIPAYDTINGITVTDAQRVSILTIDIERSSTIFTENDFNNYKMQIEQSSEGTSYEPMSYNEYNIMYSGKLDIPTYNMIKYVCNLPEVM